MRVSDIMLSNGFINNVGKTREKIQSLSQQIASSTRVNKPSDAPESATKILRLGIQLNQNENYTKNIDNSLGFMNETTFALESIQSEVTDVLTKLSELNNATNASNYKTFADQIELSLQSIIDSANSQTDGKYIFGGTDNSTSPFGYTSDGQSVETKSSNNSGKQMVKVSSSIFQKINMTGSEIFGSILKGSGNLDSSSAVGDVYNTSATIYDSSKQAYSFNSTYTKTADNKYSLTYDILDVDGNSVYSSPPEASELKFDAGTGELSTIDGKLTSVLKINNPASHIDFSFDLNSVGVSGSPSAVGLSLNQKSDVFNTLIRIKNDLNNGIKPSEEDEQLIKDFNTRILDKTTEAGNIMNQLTDTKDLLSNQKSVAQGLLANEQDVDVAKAIIELQNYNYLLETAYKVSASILPKSLLDYI